MEREKCRERSRERGGERERKRKRRGSVFAIAINESGNAVRSTK